MKKQLLTILSSIVLATSVAAQPVIQSSEVAYTVGDNFTIHACLWESAGPAGANQTWDYSGLVSQASIPIEMLDPSATASGSEFPGSTVASYVAVQQSYQYFDMTGSSLVNYGLAVGTTPIPYSDTEVMFNFPLEYGDVHNDDFEGTFFSQVNWTREGTTTSEVDGYGTLITPTGTFTDVVRVKILQDYSDEPSGVPQTVSYETEVYHWYKAGIHYPVLVNSTFISNGQTQANVQYTDVSTGIREADLAHVAVFPNPTTEVINVIGNEFSKATFEVTDMLGKMVCTGAVTSGQIDVNSLPNGVYVLKLISIEGKVGVSKFQVSK